MTWNDEFRKEDLVAVGTEFVLPSLFLPFLPFPSLLFSFIFLHFLHFFPFPSLLRVRVLVCMVVCWFVFKTLLVSGCLPSPSTLPSLPPSPSRARSSSSSSSSSLSSCSIFIFMLDPRSRVPSRPAHLTHRLGSPASRLHLPSALCSLSISYFTRRPVHDPSRGPGACPYCCCFSAIRRPPSVAPRLPLSPPHPFRRRVPAHAHTTHALLVISSPLSSLLVPLTSSSMSTSTSASASD